MPQAQVMQTMASIDQQRDLEIQQIPRSDPDYDKKVKDITARAKQTRYKAMKNLNNNNERIPARVKEGMVRRKSLQVPHQ